MHHVVSRTLGGLPGAFFAGLVTAALLGVMLLLVGCAGRQVHRGGLISPPECIDAIRFTQDCDPVPGKTNQVSCNRVLVTFHCVAPKGAKRKAAGDHEIPVRYGPEESNEQKH